jgi:hypothetical protein
MHALHTGDIDHMDETEGRAAGVGLGVAHRAAAAVTAEASVAPNVTTPIRPNERQRRPEGTQPEAFIEIEWTPDWTP